MFSRKFSIGLYSVVALVILACVIMSFGLGAETTKNDTAILTQIKVIEAALAKIKTTLDVPKVMEVKQSPLFSPRQIDRPAMGVDAPLDYIAEANTKISDPRKLDIMLGLLTWSKGGDFQKSLRDQALKWFRGENTKAEPLSSKQYAWAGFVTQPLKYPDPYTIIELYPNGRPQR